MLTSVGHDLSDLQDDDVPEESVDDSDSERGVPPAASKFNQDKGAFQDLL